MIILPAIDLRGGNCVRLQQGDYNQETVYSDNPGIQARQWQDQPGKFLHLVDLDGARDGHPVNLEAIKSICQSVDIPCELGGGIRTVQDAEKIFSAGVSRIILGTIACEQPELVKEMLKTFGAEKIVIGIDAKKGMAAVRGWLKSSGLNAMDLAEKFADMGVVRIIYTDISTDGMLSGPNYEAMAELCDRIPSCQIIASGGVSQPENITKLVALGKANLEGAIVGKALYDGRTTLEALTAAAC
jgi:phosphoribosylformimino-5-aminoimidazole carboxamide ribotide isomerase